MENAKISFKSFVDRLVEIFKENNKELKERKSLRREVMYCLWGHIDREGDNKSLEEKAKAKAKEIDRVSKINNVDRFLDSEDLLQFINNCYFEQEFYSVAKPTVKSKDKEESEDEEYLEVDNDTLYELVHQYYDEINPYPWLDLLDKVEKNTINDMDADIDEQTLFNQLLHLSAYIGLNYNDYKNTKGIIAPPDAFIDGLTKHLVNHPHAIFRSKYRAGKTGVLKYYANQNRTSVFYLDAKENGVTEKTILHALRPDLEFWETNNFSEYEELINPLDKEFINDLDNLNQLICADDTLIIDHVENNEVEKLIKKFKNLSCKIIIVTLEYNIDMIPKNMRNIVYDYENFKTIEKMLKDKKYYNAPLGSEEIRKASMKIGSDKQVYSFLCASQRQNYGSFQTDLITKIAKSSSVKEYDEIIKNCNLKCSVYKKPGNYLFTSIKNEYDSFNPEELQCLRALGKVQYEEDASKLILEIAVNPQMTKKLKKYDWIEGKKLQIPEFVVAVLNQERFYSIEEDSYNLKNLWVYSNILEGLTNIEINKNAIHYVTEFFHEDYSGFISARRKKILDANNKTTKKHNKNMMDLKQDEKKQVSQIQSNSSLIIQMFYFSAMYYAYCYGDNDLWENIIEFVDAKVNECGEVIEGRKLYLTIWKNIKSKGMIPKEIIRDFDNYISSMVNNKSPESFYIYECTYFLLLNYYINLASAVTLGLCCFFIDFDPRNYNAFILKISQDIYKRLFDVVSELLGIFENAKSEGLFMSAGKEFFTLKHVVSKMYYSIYKIMCYGRLDKTFYQIRELIKEGVQLIIIKQHYLAVLGFVIIYTTVFYRERKVITEFADEFYTLADTIGDLPTNIEKIVSITKKFIKNNWDSN